MLLAKVARAKLSRGSGCTVGEAMGEGRPAVQREHKQWCQDKQTQRLSVIAGVVGCSDVQSHSADPPDGTVSCMQFAVCYIIVCSLHGIECLNAAGWTV